MKRENRPRRCPQLQIGLAFDAVDIREEAGHQSGSDQQSQRYKTLMHQENIRFSARIAHGIVQVTKAEQCLVLWSVPATLPPHGGQACGDAEKSRPYTKQSTCDYG